MDRKSYQRLVIVIVAVLAVVPVVFISRKSGLPTAPAAFFIASSSRVLVSIHGDVTHPGIYQVPANTLTSAVIKMAGSGKQLQVLFPRGVEHVSMIGGEELALRMGQHGEATLSITKIPVQQRLILGLPLDLETMTVDDFDRVPGIGPALAERIVTYRQLNGGKLRKEDLQQIEGIGAKKYARLARLCQVPESPAYKHFFNSFSTNFKQ